MMTDSPTPGSALTLTRLLVVSLIVGPLSSCGSSLIVAGGSMVVGGAQSAAPFDTAGIAAFAFLFIAVMATIVSLLFVIAALWLLALPLTLLFTRVGIGAATRDLALLAVAAAAAVPLWLASAAAYEGQGWILPVYALASAILWVIALHHIERRNRT